ncbi:hypothetical protein [Oscillatoria salina]|uniref:hypothetical protein n=1 Tax=Oscillatoria salina TaxID=331517 RepID=UPI0013B95543|nr:hypothetical protein [Oscillatoria salina]MBZ8182156.1 hypothetical protein [Oscillatoria salina IIICB1]NET89129.1 hypothetical protein [Kamptonema sp. SIO1D9]
MTFFNSAEPIFRRKQKELDFQDLQGLLRLQLRLKNTTFLSLSYTRIDQVFVLWGLVSATIFITAQFAPISWITQAIWWTILTIIGTGMTIALTDFWVKVERLRWVLYTWVVLMLVGVGITDLGIFLGWGLVLMNLCNLWLGLCAVGYFCTGFGMRSRAFLLSGSLQLLGIAILPYFLGWQFVATGIIMAANLLIFAETQWDMRPPIQDYDLLTPEQKQFNQNQYQLRQYCNHQL